MRMLLAGGAVVQVSQVEDVPDGDVHVGSNTSSHTTEAGCEFAIQVSLALFALQKAAALSTTLMKCRMAQFPRGRLDPVPCHGN